MPDISRKLIITRSGEMKFEHPKPVEAAPSGVSIRQGPPGVLVRSHNRPAKPDTDKPGGKSP